MDGLWTEVCGQQKQSNDPGNNRTSSIRQLLGAADAQTAHHAAFSIPQTTPARAAANRKQRPDTTCEGKNG